MILKSLRIHRGYGSLDDPLRGEIKFATDGGNELKITLDEQLLIDIVKLCAGAVAQAGKEAADSLVADANSVNLIEHQDG